MSRATVCFSMYSLMSMRIIACSSSNRNSASARASSVLPDARRAEENERADGPVRILQSAARAAHRIRHGPDRFLLPDDALLQTLFHLHQFLALAFEHLRDGNAGPGRDHFGDVFLGDFLAEQPFAVRRAVVRSLLRAGEFLLQIGNACRIESAPPCSDRRCAALSPAPVFACSNWPLMMPTALMAAFSFCHCALSCDDFSFNSASCFSIFSRRSFAAASFSFFSACCSISSCMIWRSS